ncbi:unnamed protein product, partial [Mesorhabditis belari]|uniref:Ubiquitin carboxyl-terminal hydrolase n=1 Tax=Mesorhabditis belari TaxID=2138241 RepID=A0AAF3F7D2_9BILA
MTSGCGHLKVQLEKGAGNLYNIYRRLLQIIYPSELKLYQMKAALIRCDVRGCTARQHELLLCTQCNTCRCLNHINEHAAKTSTLGKRHDFAISLEYGHIFCNDCHDYVYTAEMERLRTEAYDSNQRFLGLPRSGQWSLNTHCIEPIAITSSSNIADHSLRGIVNLGNTCFMNSIIQSLVHMPAMRDYFLSDQHTHPNTSKSVCLMCMVNEAFQELLQPNWEEPVVLKQLLGFLWSSSKQLAGYHQQDAHEFLITLLELLHSHSKPIESPILSTDCKCVIDKIFTGQMQSDLTCNSCSHVSVRVDPFLDIALNVPIPVNGELEAITLEKCLDRYVQNETIPCTNCEKCGGRGLTKQLTFKKLPIVAIFQLKRFHHEGQLRKKISSIVRFPMELDMTRYLTAYHTDASQFDSNKGSCSALKRQYNRYELYAVVQHSGSMDTGHYTCFVRRGQQWFKCDDDAVYAVPPSTVSMAECYLLFYQTTALKFQSPMDTST